MEPLVRLDRLVVRFERFTLGPIDLSADSGEIFCLVGPNGSGKTTMISSLLGLLPATEGGALIRSVPTRGRPPEVLRQVGYAPDDTNETIPELTAWELWELHALAHSRVSGSVDEMLQRAEQLAERLDFAPPPAPISSFSHGMCRKTQLVAALLHDPSAVVLDEPRNGLDPIAIERLEQMLFEQRERGKLVLLATHDLRFAERLADRVCVLHRGRAIAVGPPAELRLVSEDNLVQAFFRLVAGGAEP